ncbi:MAG: NAD(P)-dependent oxidoreductase [Thermoplasmatota archaeon]
MSKVLVTFEPRDDGERAAVAKHLPDAAWLVDGADPEGAEAILTFWPRREFTKAGLELAALPDLKLVQLATAGANHVPWSLLPEHVPVAAAPGATAPFIAEHVLAVTLAWARGLFHQTAEIKAGRFDVGAPVRSLSELTVGLVGYGGIGKHTARLLGGLGARCIAVTRSGAAAADEAVAWCAGMEHLPSLLAEADVIVLCLPLTSETQNLVDIDFLAPLMGRRVLLVNVARGLIVDEVALHAWLDSSHTKHWAALDTWWQYPPNGEGRPFTEAFHQLPNVIMTPHNSPNVAGYRHAMLEAAAARLAKWQKSGEVEEKDLVDRAAHRLHGGGDGDPRG